MLIWIVQDFGLHGFPLFFSFLEGVRCKSSTSLCVTFICFLSDWIWSKPMNQGQKGYLQYTAEALGAPVIHKFSSDLVAVVVQRWHPNVPKSREGEPVVHSS